MAESRIELTDEMLGAYADGELDARDTAAVERLVAADPSVRQRLSAIEELTRLVRAAGAMRSAYEAPKIEAPVRRFGWLSWQSAVSFAAGALVILAVVNLTGAPHSGTLDPASLDWHEHALAFHDMYVRAREHAPDDALTDIPASHSEDLARLVDFVPAVPDLGAHGYGAVGAHLLAAPHGPVVYVVFEGEQRPPIGFAMTRRSADSTDRDATTAAVRSNPNGVTLVSWSAGAFDFGLSGQASPIELMPLVETVRSSLPVEAL